MKLSVLKSKTKKLKKNLMKIKNGKDINKIKLVNWLQHLVKQVQLLQLILQK